MASDWTIWTVRCALACYAASVWLQLRARPGDRSAAAARLCWTIGCAAFLGHVAAAFHFEHGWSHTQAWAHTVERTREIIGWNWGGGLWVNYGFTLLWAADAAWWWASARSYQARPPLIAALLHGFMLFVIFNATVVFGSGAIRWCGLAGMMLLAAAWWRRHTRVARPSWP